FHEGKRANEHAIDDRVDRGGRAHPEGEGEERDHREPRGAPQSAQRVANVGEQRVHVRRLANESFVPRAISFVRQSLRDDALASTRSPAGHKSRRRYTQFYTYRAIAMQMMDRTSRPAAVCPPSVRRRLSAASCSAVSGPGVSFAICVAARPATAPPTIIAMIANAAPIPSVTAIAEWSPK